MNKDKNQDPILKYYSKNKNKDVSFRENLIKDLYLLNKTNSFDMQETLNQTILEADEFLKFLYKKTKKN